MKKGTLDNIAETSRTQKVSLIVSQIIHFVFALYFILSLLGITSYSAIFVSALALCFIDAPFQCALNVISTYFVKNLYDRGVYLNNRDKVSLTRKAKIVLIPESLLLKALQSKDVTVKIDESYTKSREEIIKLIWAMTKDSVSLFFDPLKKYFSFNELQLSGNTEGVLSEMSDIASVGEYEISCKFKGSSYRLRKAVRDNINESNAFDIPLHTVIQIIINDKHAGYILYNYADTEFMNCELYLDSEKNRFYVLSEDFRRFEKVYTRLMRDQSCPYYNTMVAEVADPENEGGIANGTADITVLTDAARYPYLMDKVNISLVDRSPELLIYVSEKYRKYKYLSGMLIFLYAFLSVMAFFGTIIIESRMFLGFSVALKALMICIFSYAAKKRIDTKGSGSSDRT